MYFDKILDWLTKGMVALGVLLVACMFVLINVEIFCRYVLSTSTLLADEYCSYFFAVVAYAGLSYALYNDKLIKIDLPGAWSRLISKPFLRLLKDSAAVVLNSILLYAIWQTFSLSLLFQSRSIQPSRTLLAYPQGVVMACIALLCLISICMFVKTLRELLKGENRGEGA